MILVLISAAAALEGLPGQWLPGASPLSARQGWFGAGVAWDWSGPGGEGPGMLVRGVVGAGPRLAINAEGHLTRGERSNRGYVGEALSWDAVPAALQSIFFPSSRDLWIWRDRPEIPGKDVGIQYGGQFSEERKKTEPPSPFKVKI